MRLMDWFFFSAIVGCLVAIAGLLVRSVIWPNETSHEGGQTVEFNLHDDYSNPFDVCHDRFDSSPLAASEPWQHVTIVLCASQDSVAPLMVVTQSGRSAARVEEWDRFGRSEVIASLTTASSSVDTKGACGGHSTLGIYATVFEGVNGLTIKAHLLLLSGMPMCFDEARSVIWIPGTPISFTKVTLAP